MSQRSKLILKLTREISQNSDSESWEVRRQISNDCAISAIGELQPMDNIVASSFNKNRDTSQGVNNNYSFNDIMPEKKGDLEPLVNDAVFPFNNITESNNIDESYNATVITPEAEFEFHTVGSSKQLNTSCSSSSSDDESVEKSEDERDPFYTSDDTNDDPNYSSASESENSSHSDDRASEVLKEISNVVEKEKIQNTNKVKKTKKRKRNKSEWKKNAGKIARNCGKEYVSCSKSKKVIQAREMKPPCGESCKLKCNSIIPTESRKLIFENYWAVGDSQRQRDYLASCMRPVKPKYQYHRNQSKRRDNNSFHFAINGNYVRVCKSYFKSTLGITDRPIRTVISKRNAVEGIVLNDLRGKHGKHPKLDANIREGIRQHINSIPRIESHYTRARSSCEYIEGGKSLRDLHRDYVKDCIDNNLPYGKYLIYHQVFTREFNISFFTPKKDQCSVCATYTNATEEEKQNLANEYEIHLSEKELSRIEKQADKQKIGPNYLVACFDLQAVLPCPKGDTSTFYYKSKLNVLNFTVYEMSQKDHDDQCYCYIWDETQGQRGANEIGSCLLNYIKEKSRANNNDIEIVLYSDNCVGQQKNRFILTMYAYALIKYPNIKSITHKFLILGHTQNEGDSAHSVIERQVKRTLKSGPIFLPAEYVGIIKSAKKSGKPFVVKEMSFQDFFDLKKLNERIGNMDKKNMGDDKLTDLKIIKIEKSNPYKVLYKNTYAEVDFAELDLKRPRTVNKAGEKLHLEPLYKEKLKFSEKKKKGLLSLLANKHIPIRHSEFYNNL